MMLQPKTVSELPSINKGIARNRFQQVAPSRSVANAAFKDGNIHFAWSVSGSTMWCPKKSYFRLRVNYTQGTGGVDGAALTIADNVAPSAFMCSNLFQSVEFRIGGQTVSRCSQNIAQVDALKSRMTRSGKWLDDLGELQNFTSSDVKSRQTEITSDADGDVPYFKVLRSKGGLELIYRPPLSILDTKGCLPSGQYEIVLNPQSEESYKKGSIINLGDAIEKVPGTDFKFEVVDFYWMLALVDTDETVSSTQYTLDLADIECQSQKLDTASLSQTFFQVPSTTSGLAVAFQDTRVTSSTVYSASEFKVEGGVELALNRMFLSYANQNKPSPDADPSFNATTDRSAQLYQDTYSDAGAVWDVSPPESYKEWTDRGRYYYFKWHKDGSDASTRVIVNSQFVGETPVTYMNMLLFSISRRAATVTVKDGQVVSVEIFDR